MTCDARLLPFVPFAQRSHSKFFPRGPFVSVTLAQLAVESAYGERMSGKNNPFGIKATPVQIATGKSTIVWTKEFINGFYQSKHLYFADYDSIEDAFDAHAFLLTHPWYKDCMEAQTAQDYAHALYRDHYATAPNYASVLISVMDQNDLYQFDHYKISV